MRFLLVLALLLPPCATAQTRAVQEGELALWVEVDETAHLPLVREMILITIRGIYRRHITLEALQQPPLDGFSWTQLGPDKWTEERINGAKVKIFERRMALYADRAGVLDVGTFSHRLTLTDENDAWFEHEVKAEPVEIEVAPPPDGQEWWFPVRSLRVSDNWSNAPDQLQPGEGVLRVIRVEALGVTPEMIPPMPDLTSPSAMIFPHPDQRFVELSRGGPISYAFWRWTIRPTNDILTIVEPLGFSYFDTVGRAHRAVEISAQRVAYGDAIPTAPAAQGHDAEAPPEAALPGWGVAAAAGLVLVGGLWAGLRRYRFTGRGALSRFGLFDMQARALTAAAKRGDVSAVRRAAQALLRRDGDHSGRRDLLAALDRAVFDPAGTPSDLVGFARTFRQMRPRTGQAPPSPS